MNDHIPKPIEPEDLWAILLKWINRPDATAVATEQAPQIAHEAKLPSGIVGLDVANALRRVLGKKPLYLSMLRKFVAGQKHIVAEIREAVEGSSWADAERLAHTLTGVVGSIGATGLQPLTKELHAAIKERRAREEIDAGFDALKMPLEHLIAQLEQQLLDGQGKTTVQVDRKNLKMVCDQLEALLIDDDAAVTGVLDANADLLNAAFPKHYRKIDDGIRSYDFNAALSALKAATETLA